MEQRIHFVTVRVEDLAAATRYYEEALGWRPLLAVPGEVTFFQSAPGQVLALFAAEGFDADTGGHTASFSIAHNVDTDQEVDEVVALMVAGGARVLKAPQLADWGGYHGVVADPAGCVWEVAHNPGFAVADDGTVRIGGGED